MPAYTIKKCIQEMESSKLIIPSFQRDYVWKMSQIETLFDSLMRKIPINSFLIWNLRGDLLRNNFPFEFYKFFSEKTEREDNEKATTSGDEYKAVIDGQQRLTSLYIGFMGSYSESKNISRRNTEKRIERKLYLCLNNSDSSEDMPESNRYNFKFLSIDEINKRHENENLSTFPEMFRDKSGTWWISVSKIPAISNETQLDQWKATVPSGGGAILKLWNLYHNIPTIEAIEWDNPEISEAITVFVRYNSGGKTLTPAEVIMSAIAPYWPDVRKKFKELINQVKVHGFKIGVDFIIKALLTVYAQNPANNLKSITREASKTFEDNWNKFSFEVGEMFGELEKLGFSDKNLSSYNATLPILFYLLKVGNHKLKDEDWKEIGTWLIRTLLLESFSGNSDNAIRNAIRPLTNLGNSTFPSEMISQSLISSSKNLDPYDFLAMQKNDKNAPLLMSILLPEIWNIKSELDHLHPISKFKKTDNEYPRANSIVNLQPLRGNQNARKKDSEFKEWIQSTYKDKNKEKEDYLISIGINPATSLEFVDREALWLERENFLKKKLDKLFPNTSHD